MPRMQRMDISPVHQTNGWLPPPSLPVCKRTQVLDRGAGSGWPFLYSYTSSGCVINTAPRQSKYAQAEEIGEAWV